MNPLVFMILISERDLEIQRQKCRDRCADPQNARAALQPKQESRRGFFRRSRPQKPCECS
jgi:hypothetical protein